MLNAILARPSPVGLATGFSLHTDGLWQRWPCPPALWLVAALAAYRRRQRLKRARCCQRCGYDLRATPERCPQKLMSALVANERPAPVSPCPDRGMKWV